MTNPTVSAAGGAMSRATLTFDVKRGMYGTCKRITGRIGKCGEIFAEAYFTDLASTFLMLTDRLAISPSTFPTARKQSITSKP